jgi:hypothetical protein
LLDGLLSSSFGFCGATHSPHRPRQQHPVMREANDLDHPVRAYAIGDDVPGAANALFLRSKAAPNAKWVNPDVRGCRYFLGPGRSGTAAKAAKTHRINKS